MVTLTHSDAPGAVGGDGLRGPWDTVEDEQAEMLSTVASSRRWSERHGSGATYVQRSLRIVPEAHAYLKGPRSTNEESVCQTDIRRAQPWRHIVRSVR